MGVLGRMERKGHEMVVFGLDPEVGLKAIVAVHSTLLGPACGGVRMFPYGSEEEALEDALRLSEAMTLKSAAAGVSLGGGKCVVIGDPKRDKTEPLLLSLGRLVDSLGGKYVAASDVGMTVEDLVILSRATKHVASLPVEMGGSGDSSPLTAVGVVHAIRAALERLFGSGEVSGRTFAVQGLGKVGFRLARLLVEQGGKVFGADVDGEKAEKAERELGVEIVPPEEILFVECDVLCPCALGGVLNSETIPKLRCKAVCGAANNQLADEREDARRLKEAGVLYVPDFVANAGGIINISVEFEPGGYSEERALEKAAVIYENAKRVLEMSDREGITTHEAALRLAEERLEAARRSKASRAVNR